MGFLERAELWVTGIVQGVGFRPFCVRTAKALGLCGTVRNTSGGVEVALEGEGEAIDEYLRVLREAHPAAAVVTGVEVRRAPLSCRVFADFSVLPSAASKERNVLIPADLAVCEDCLAEMRDPRNRRYRYPFINCTNCGPRYTIIRTLPYDRPLTTMAAFPMCPECQREYHNPADRRCHAQPNACPVCGPKVRLMDAAGRQKSEGEEAMEKLVSELKAGKLAAIKGLGGFHIACLPEDGPLRDLRLRKHRPDKPFALMVRDADAARTLAEISPEAERLLSGVERPIVLCPARPGAPVSPLAAPGQKRLGLMLPYTPLHYLIMEDFPALVMTSANLSGVPIVSTDEGVLSGVADLVLTHDRAIHTAIDDSVLLPATGRNSIFLRRARGYVPNPATLPPELHGIPDILAAGAQLKSTYALTRGGTLFPGQYLGDLGQLETAAYYKRSLKHFLDLYGIEPRILACDKHPNYAAAGLAKEVLQGEAALCPIQHHHAHLASVLLDNGSFEPVIGAVFDGTGYGDDGTIWGGEFLVGDAKNFTRMGSLYPPFRLLGGERAIHEPWRCALALLCEALGEGEAKKIAATLWPQYENRIEPLLAVLGVTPATTSCGRLFDGFSALLGLCSAVSYDAQAAMALENAADLKSEKALPFTVEEVEEKGENFVCLDWRGAVEKAVLGNLRERGRTAMAFHRGLARAVAEVCALLSKRTGIKRAALSGGVWQNAALLDLTREELIKRGFAVLTHRNISPNDEGVSAGQALAAAYHHFRGD
jgi:hydrogenase maturation protein HypF